MRSLKSMLCFATTALAVSAASCAFRGEESGPPLDCEEDSTATGGLIINEFMASNALSITDGDDKNNHHDWVELYNTTDQEISLCGWGVTDDLDEPKRVVIEHESVVPPGGHRFLWLTGGEEPAAADRVPLRFDASDGGEIGLSAPDGEFSDRVVFGPQETDFSAAREADGSEEWIIAWRVTPGEPNADSGPDVTHSEDPSASPEMAPEAGDLTEVILGYDEMPEIGIRIEPEDIESLKEHPRTWAPGFLIYDEREYGPVGIRLKGHNSFQPIDEKPSFRININEYVDAAEFFGKVDLTLNNMDCDFSMMHERLAYLVARELGPASRANHALVTVNNEFYGLYTNVETVKHHMLRRWYSDEDGALFDVEDLAQRPEDVEKMELQDGPDDRSLLRGLAEALTIEDPAEALAAASEYVDMAQFRRFWAMSAVIGQFDGFPYSSPGDDYFLYADPTGGKLQFIPWGMDETFYSAEFDINETYARLAEKCRASGSCYQKFVDRVWEALAVTEDIDLAAERDRVAEQIAPYVSMDQRKPYSDEKVSEFQAQLRYFIEGRRAHLSEMLPAEDSP